MKRMLSVCSCILLLGLFSNVSAAPKKSSTMFIKPFVGLEYQYEHIKSNGAYHLLLPANFQFGNVFAGAKFHKNFGLELGYYRTLSTSQNQFQFYDWGGEEVSGLTASTARTTFSGFSVDANIYYALDPFFNIFAVLGLETMNEQLTVTATGSNDLAPALNLISGKTNTVPRLGVGGEYIDKHWGMRGRMLWAYTQGMKINVSQAQQLYPALTDKPYLQAVIATVGVFYIF